MEVGEGLGLLIKLEFIRMGEKLIQSCMFTNTSALKTNTLLLRHHSHVGQHESG